MTVIDMVAKELKMKPKEVIKESLFAYLRHRLTQVESDIFKIVKKHGIKDIFELDARATKGLINEFELYDDYFALDNLEAEKMRINKLLEKI